jgi:hypothetical protein
MKKEIPNIPETKQVKELIGTQYVLLPDGRVARLLKPMKINDSLHYNLIVNYEYTRCNADKVLEMTKKHFSEVFKNLKK